MKSILIDPRLKQVSFVEYVKRPEVFPFLIDAAKATAIVLTPTLHVVISPDAAMMEDQRFWCLKGFIMPPMGGKALLRTHHYENGDLIADEEVKVAVEDVEALILYPEVRYLGDRTVDQGFEDTGYGVARKVYYVPLYEEIKSADIYAKADEERKEENLTSPTKLVWTVYDNFQTNEEDSTYTGILYRDTLGGQPEQLKSITKDSLPDLYNEMQATGWERFDSAEGEPADVLEHWVQP